MRAIFASNRASLIPMQFLGPYPKGMQTQGWRLAFSSGVNLVQNKGSEETSALA